MVGGYLPENDSLTIKILTNPEVIAVNQNSTDNREIYSDQEITIWTASIPGTEDKYYAIFNTSDRKIESFNINWSLLGLSGTYLVNDLWSDDEPVKLSNLINITLEPHASRLLRFTTN
jgi:hypothetical protein